nr:hypothetical protein CFP56_20908 [Quercus suber]
MLRELLIPEQSCSRNPWKSTESLSCLLRVTIKGGHPLNTAANNKQHPQVPPLHLHFSQTETFQILKGKFGVEAGWDRRNHILTPESGPFDIPPWVPHMPYPVPGHDDTVVLLWAHPQIKDDALDAIFFERLFLLLDKRYRQGTQPDALQMLLWSHETASVGVMLPSWKLLGPLRWLMPWLMQAGMAVLAKVLGYESLQPHTSKAE